MEKNQSTFPEVFQKWNSFHAAKVHYSIREKASEQKRWKQRKIERKRLRDAEMKNGWETESPLPTPSSECKNFTLNVCHRNIKFQTVRNIEFGACETHTQNNSSNDFPKFHNEISKSDCNEMLQLRCLNCDYEIDFSSTRNEPLLRVN